MLKTARQPKSKLKIAVLVFVCFIAILSSIIVYKLIDEKPVVVNNNIATLDKILTGHTKDVWTVRFSPDGNMLATGSVDSTVKLWDKESGKTIAALKQPIGITALEFSPDGKYIVTASYDGIVRVWNVAEKTIAKELKGHAGTVWTIDISADGKTIASSGEDRSIKLWNIDSGNLIRTINAHDLNVWKVRFAPDGNKIVSSSFDKLIKIWDVHNGSLLKTLEGHTEAVVGLAVSNNGKLLASSSDDMSIKLWNLQTGALIRTLPGSVEHVYAVAFSPDDKMLVSGSRDQGTMGELIQNFFGNRFLHKGTTAKLWDVGSGKLLQTFTEHQNDVMDVTFSPDGKYIATASDDKTIELWHLNQ